MCDFWNSYHRKARKEHTCDLCGKPISKGESYYRESGKNESDFCDYCFCERCRTLLDICHDGEALTCLHDMVIDIDMLRCPECGSISLYDYYLSDDYQLYKCECECGNMFEVDVSEKAIEEFCQTGGDYARTNKHVW